MNDGKNSEITTHRNIQLNLLTKLKKKKKNEVGTN